MGATCVVKERNMCLCGFCKGRSDSGHRFCRWCTLISLTWTFPSFHPSITICLSRLGSGWQVKKDVNTSFSSVVLFCFSQNIRRWSQLPPPNKREQSIIVPSWPHNRRCWFVICISLSRNTTNWRPGIVNSGNPTWELESSNVAPPPLPVSAP